MHTGAANTFRVPEDDRDRSLATSTPSASVSSAAVPADNSVAAGVASVTAGVESFEQTNAYIGEGRSEEVGPERRYR